MKSLHPADPAIAVLLPCYNEEQTIGAVVRGFREALPQATIYVYDNNSTDLTALQARAGGAIVIREPRQGKGNVVRRMFADIEADIYVMADGDGTYDPQDAPQLINTLLTERVDMVVGTRRGVQRVESAGVHHVRCWLRCLFLRRPYLLPHLHYSKIRATRYIGWLSGCLAQVFKRCWAIRGNVGVLM